MDVYVATKNAGKLRELQAIFGAYNWRLSGFPSYPDVVEGEDSYEDNAALKARSLFAQLRAAGLNCNVLGDDSGLEIAVLGGRPGVLSARYGGPDASWQERRTALLHEVDAAKGDRAAVFVCALHFIDADGSETAVLRRLAGKIADAEYGTAGFSYDPIFFYPPLSLTFGELDEQQKNAISHRALAARALVDKVSAKAVDTAMQNVHGDGT